MSDFVYDPPTENYDVDKVIELFNKEDVNIREKLMKRENTKTVEYLNKYFFCIKDNKDSGVIMYAKYVIDVETGKKNIILFKMRKSLWMNYHINYIVICLQM